MRILHYQSVKVKQYIGGAGKNSKIPAKTIQLLSGRGASFSLAGVVKLQKQGNSLQFRRPKRLNSNRPATPTFGHASSCLGYNRPNRQISYKVSTIAGR